MTLLLGSTLILSAGKGALTLLALLGSALLVGMATSASPLVPSTSPDADTILGEASNITEQIQYITAAGAVTGGGGSLGAATPIAGRAVVNGAGALALTLANPVAGVPSAGGNDGLSITILNVDGHQHTVTTAANKINGNKHVFTFAATVGSKATLTAWGGVWYINPAAADGALT